MKKKAAKQCMLSASCLHACTQVRAVEAEGAMCLDMIADVSEEEVRAFNDYMRTKCARRTP